MILKQEFYFVRHGQTDHNLLEKKDKGDHVSETPLNQTGMSQAESIEPIIAKQPIQTICASPMIRAQQTKQIISAKLDAPHHDIDELGECSAEVWQKMRFHGMFGKLPEEGIAREFMERVKEGVNQALKKPGPVLIVSHGGVHWALCCLMEIEGHSWVTDNCVPIHFSWNKGRWLARKLT